MKRKARDADEEMPAAAQQEVGGDGELGASSELVGRGEATDRKKKDKKKHKQAKKAEGDSANKLATSQAAFKEQLNTVEKSLPSVGDKDSYPYPVEDDDHCETPTEAYQDLLPLLTILAQSLAQTLPDLCVYDPYFCEGSMVERLCSLGLPKVHNKKEDFYAAIATKQVPAHDVLITNPPYSQDHMERMFSYMWSSSKPFCLLLPNYVYMKDYVWKSPHVGRLFFVVPTSRYLYTTPKGRRQQKSGKFTAPFPSFWYCGNFSKVVVDQAMKIKLSTVTVARSVHSIPLNMAPDQDPRKKKLRNADKRKKHQMRKKQQTGPSTTR